MAAVIFEIVRAMPIAHKGHNISIKTVRNWNAASSTLKLIISAMLNIRKRRFLMILPSASCKWAKIFADLSRWICGSIKRNPITIINTLGTTDSHITRLKEKVASKPPATALMARAI
jgi:hypothetical protein